MNEQRHYPLPLENLCRAGDPRDTWRWEQGDPNYVKQFGLGPEHIPALIEIAQQWVDDEDRPEDDVLYAPIHAWRALGQLRAIEAVEPLLAMQNVMDKLSADWYLEEFHEVFGWIGPPAIAALAAYLADQQNAEFPRGSAAHGLCEVAKRYPEARDPVVEALTRQLANNEPDVYSLNGLLIGYLADLKAIESAEAIERAYAAGVVAEIVSGNWTVIRKELGVEGLGLVPDKEGSPFGNLMPQATHLRPATFLIDRRKMAPRRAVDSGREPATAGTGEEGEGQAEAAGESQEAEPKKDTSRTSW